MKAGLTHEAFIDPLCSHPEGMVETNTILGHFKAAPKKAQEERRGRRAPPQPRNRAQRRHQLYEEHQRLYRLGPKVLVDEIRMEGADPTTTLNELHRVYDPLMSCSSRQVDSITSKVTGLGDVQVEPFSEEEIRLVLKATDTSTAPGPGGLTSKRFGRYRLSC